ncbi:MAG: transporter [Alphaproteobacteria bacterium]
MQLIHTIARRTALLLLPGAMASLAVTPMTHASCGAAFCTINTNWNMQGLAVEPGWRLDLRAEYIKQDQPRSGRHEVNAGQIRRHHDEAETRNRNVLATLDYAVNNSMGFSVTAPVTDRSHLHIHNHRGAKIPETWDFTRLGDIRLQGRYQWTLENQENPAPSNFGVNLGVKLPTGQIHVDNALGDRAERSLQPGSGTTDLLVGAYYGRLSSELASSLFIQGQWQQPLNEREKFEPGHRITADLGYRYEATDRIGLLAQINTLYIERDSGSEAEPEDTGGEYIFLSPGVAFAVTPGAQIYGFVQAPLYQNVNGVQLTADWSVAAGVSVRF